MRRHHFLLRRLHSLSGVVPIGVFLINHLLTNYVAFEGPKHYDDKVAWIQSLPFLLLIEIFGIFVPIAFHGVLGVFIALESKGNVSQYPYMDNWRYAVQRVTAWITLAYIFIHLFHYRLAYWLGGPVFEGPDFFRLTQDGFLHSYIPAAVWLVIYLIGLTAAVYHFCNGLVTFCITWGITIGDQSRQRVSYAAAGVGAVLMVWGVLSLYSLVTTPAPPPAAPTAMARADAPPGLH
jgi:succinate dehydrogenase / fumarate reductase cytochrome b subunit